MSSVVAAAARHGSSKAFHFREDRLPFGRIDENQEDCANCDIMHLIMSSSSLSLSQSASSILSTSSSTIKQQPPHIVETDDSASSASSSSSTAAVAAPSLLTIQELQQSRRLLLGLHHGATCGRKYSLQHGGACPDHARCVAVKRLYSHVLHCRCKKECCMVPGCTKARKVWAHFGRCIDQDCSICTVIPNRSEEKRSLSQKYKQKKKTTTTCKPVAAATSSSKTTTTAAFQMSSLVAAIAASMPTVHIQEEIGRPPLSPTRSFTAPFYCYI